MSKILLADMDGTLTPARKSIEPSMITALDNFLARGWKLAIVSGSSYEYIKEQMGDWLEREEQGDRVWVMPCNGTQCKHLGKWEYQLDMRAHVGDDEFKSLMATLFMEMAHLERHPFAFTGDHVSYRGSTLNFCPVGRNANDSERQVFKDWDTKTGYRLKLANDLQATALGSIFKFKVGGHTSIDIYPHGWDKSYAFEHFRSFKEIHFVGDRTGPMGNDYEGFTRAGSFGYTTTGPVQTISLLSSLS
jgi:phosphomannomutase